MTEKVKQSPVLDSAAQEIAWRALWQRLLTARREETLGRERDADEPSVIGGEIRVDDEVGKHDD